VVGQENNHSLYIGGECMGWIIGGIVIVICWIVIFALCKVASDADDQMLGGKQYEEN
jgi:hypothetical protein